ncbi:hypothetical protein FKM82_012354 [Ascaphus truei]
MAMQKHLSVQGCHQRSITALGFHSARREFLTGFEDGVIKWWDLDNGRLSQSAAEHAGMVTHLLYWAETKLVLSSSNDGMLIAWTAGAVVFDRIKLGSPIFSIAINIRRQLLVCGFKKHLSVYPLDERKTSGHVINLKKRFSDNRHTDIVSCVVTLDNRIYTAGYDKKFIIFDTYQTAEKTCLTAVHCNSRAHEAGIIHLLLVRESESTRYKDCVCFWLFFYSFFFTPVISHRNWTNVSVQMESSSGCPGYIAFVDWNAAPTIMYCIFVRRVNYKTVYSH